MSRNPTDMLMTIRVQLGESTYEGLVKLKVSLNLIRLDYP